MPDALILARIQFGFTVAFHIIFPAFTIGLASYLAVLEGLYLATKREMFLRVFKYWVKIFAIVFAMGVVSGIVMSYQFGTNWSEWSDKTGPVLGPLIGYEVLTAFFLEAGFLGVMLFGMKKVGPKLHFAATLAVAFGTVLSAFWILSVNSWMQTPAGYGIDELGRFVPENWWAIVFNPSFPYRLVHMVLAAYLTTAFVVGAVGAYHLLRDKANPQARIMLSMAMWMALIVAPVQLVAGDLHGLNTLKHQPAKVAAMEGHYESQAGAPLYLFGVPNPDADRLDYAVGIPKLGSWILTHKIDGEVKGLADFPEDERPPVGVVFYAFRVMVGIGLLMILTGGISFMLRRQGRLYDTPWFLKLAMVMGPSGFIAVIAGWLVTEVGRQPYTVYGLMRTADSLSPVDAPAVGASLLAFIVVYFTVFGAGAVYLIRLMRQTPIDQDPEDEADKPIRSAGITPGPQQQRGSQPGPTVKPAE